MWGLIQGGYECDFKVKTMEGRYNHTQNMY